MINNVYVLTYTINVRDGGLLVLGGVLGSMINNVYVLTYTINLYKRT